MSHRINIDQQKLETKTDLKNVEQKLKEVWQELKEAKQKLTDAEQKLADAEQKWMNAPEGSGEKSFYFRYMNSAQDWINFAQNRVDSAQNRVDEAQKMVKHYNDKLISLDGHQVTAPPSPKGLELPEKPLTFDAAIDACKRLPPGSEMEFSHSFHDRENQMKEMMERVVEHNFRNRGRTDNKNHRFAVVPGGSGIGKSRFGFEVSNSINDISGKRVSTGFGTVKWPPIVTKYVFIDFCNGQEFDSDFDTSSWAGLRLGVRLAAQGLLNKRFADIIHRPRSKYVAFDTRAVLERIVINALESKDAETVVAVVLHLDEFQFYVDKTDREGLKSMLREVGQFMREGLNHTKYHKRFFIVPVLTGTSANDVSFRLMEKYQELLIHLPPLTMGSGFKMYDDKFLDGLSKEANKERERLLLARSQNHFHVALADTGLVPRIVHELLDFPLQSVQIEPDTNWGYMLSAYTNPTRQVALEDYGGAGATETIIHFALSAQLVKREFMLPGGTKVGDLERKGELILRPSEYRNQFYILMPFVQLVALNRLLSFDRKKGAFEPELLFSPTMDNPWRWQDFEELHGHFQALKMNALVGVRDCRIEASRVALLAVEEVKTRHGIYTGYRAKVRQYRENLKDLEDTAAEGFEIKELFRGALGHPDTLALRVVLEPVKCFHEKEKWISKHTDTAPVAEHVQCKEMSDVNLFGGVFLHAPNTTIFDGRFGLKGAQPTDNPVLVAVHTKHSQLGSSTKVSEEFILGWHTQARNALSKWHCDSEHRVRPSPCTHTHIHTQMQQTHDELSEL